MSKRDDLGKGVLQDLAALRAKGSISSILPTRRVDPSARAEKSFWNWTPNRCARAASLIVTR
jgi:hypothetical protein